MNNVQRIDQVHKYEGGHTTERSCPTNLRALFERGDHALTVDDAKRERPGLFRTCGEVQFTPGWSKRAFMVDNRTAASRSRLMSRIGSKHTKPELVVRTLLHRLGYRFRLHRKELPGRPDIVFIARRKAIFVHGCFWHGHGCKIGQLPKSNLDFWKQKIDRNRRHDREKRSELEQIGWAVEEVWQCELADLRSLQARLRFFLGPSKAIDIR